MKTFWIVFGLFLGWLGGLVITTNILKLFGESQNAMIVWGILSGSGAVVWLVRHIDFSGLLRAVLYVVVPFVVLGGTVVTITHSSRTLAEGVKAGTWQEAMVLIGLPENTAKPETLDGIRKLVAQTVPKDFTAKGGNPGHDECLADQTAAIVGNDIDRLRVIRSACLGAYEVYRLEQLKKLFVINPTSPQAMVLLNSVVSVLGAIFLISLRGVGKITGALVWCAAIFWALSYFELPDEHVRALAWDLLWYPALKIRLVELALAAVGLVVAEIGDAWSHEQNQGFLARWIPRLIIAAVAGVLAVSVDSLWQTQIIAEAVFHSGGHISADLAYRLYQIASLGGLSIIGVVGTTIIMWKAALAARHLP